MNVLEFSQLMSDVHKPIEIALARPKNDWNAFYPSSFNASKEQKFKVKRWDGDKKEDFILNLNNRTLLEIEYMIESLKTEEKSQLKTKNEMNQ